MGRLKQGTAFVAEGAPDLNLLPQPAFLSDASLKLRKAFVGDGRLHVEWLGKLSLMAPMDGVQGYCACLGALNVFSVVRCLQFRSTHGVWGHDKPDSCILFFGMRVYVPTLPAHNSMSLSCANKVGMRLVCLEKKVIFDTLVHLGVVCFKYARH